MAELTIKFPQVNGRRFLMVSAAIAAVAGLVGLTTFHFNRGPSVSSIVGPVSGFTPYFFSHGRPPDQYTVNKSHSIFADHILQLTLDKFGHPSVVVTEQAMPAQLSAQTLLASDSQIRGAAGPATVDTLDEHVVGTLLPSEHATLILITGPQNASSSDITDLLKALRPSS